MFLNVRDDARRNDAMFETTAVMSETTHGTHAGELARPAQRGAAATFFAMAAASASTVAVKRSRRASWVDAAAAGTVCDGVRRRSLRFSTPRLRLEERLRFFQPSPWRYG